MYVGTYETQAQQMGKRGKISDVWGTLSKAQSTPDLLGDRTYDEDTEQDDRDTNGIRDTTFLQEPASIFNRPGFGSVAFRRAVSSSCVIVSRYHFFRALQLSNRALYNTIVPFYTMYRVYLHGILPGGSCFVTVRSFSTILVAILASRNIL